MMGPNSMMRSASSKTSQGLDEEIFGTVYNPSVVKRFLPYLVPYKRLILLATVSMMIFTATQVAVPWIIKLCIDDYIVSGNMTGLSWIIVMFLGMTLLNWGTNFSQEILLARVGQGVLYRLRRHMFSHLQKLSLDFYNKMEVGRIMSRVQGDVYQLQEFTSLAVTTTGDLLGLLGIMVAVLLLNVKLGLIAMAMVPILVLAVVVWQPYAIKSFIRVRRSASIVNGALNENITGVRVVQSLNRQKLNLKQFDEKNSQNLSSGLAATRFAAGLLPPVDILTAAAIGLTLYFGSNMVQANSMDPETGIEVGTLIAFILYIQRFFDPIRNLTMQYTQLQRAMASGSRIFELLDTKPNLVDRPNAEQLTKMNGDLDFKHVSYGYIPGQDVLKDLNLHISHGETVAIVGPTGAGKTTLVSLISRFYDLPNDRNGAIFVDGHDLRTLKRTSLLHQMSMVLQEPFLFSGTVRENIKYNHRDVSESEMVNAAKAVGADNFIVDLENGYDTYLHERWINLSLGQRQLISFARAIVANPSILILDEATANIDSDTEMLIQLALKKLLKGRTAIVIAHRLSTIRNADKIVVLNHGEIVEVGTHSELISNKGMYASLYNKNYVAINGDSKS